MDEYPMEASVDVIQALRRALYLYRPHLASNINISNAVKDRLEQVEKKIEKIEHKAETLAGITHKSHDILFRANTVFPFNLFPDTVVVDREKLTIANRFFFSTAKIISVPIRDIQSVEADVGPFFGSIKMNSRFFFTNPRAISYLKRNDTIKLQRLLQGYIIANEQDIDCSMLSTERLEVLLEDLGKGDTG